MTYFACWSPGRPRTWRCRYPNPGRGPGRRPSLDEELEIFPRRPLDHVRFPYVYLDATYVKARVNYQIVSRAVIIATGVSEAGGREVLGVMTGDSEAETFWAAFLRDLRERGLTGVRLVISDSHLGLVKAIRKVMIGAAWQRCRVHFVRNVFGCTPKGHAAMIAATIRTIFAQPDAEAVAMAINDRPRKVLHPDMSDDLPSSLPPPARASTPPLFHASTADQQRFRLSRAQWVWTTCPPPPGR